MAGRARALTPLSAALAFAMSACGGGGEETIDETALRDCLAGGGIEIEAGQSAASPKLGNASPDFRGTLGAANADVIVERDSDRAERTAADLRGTLASFGVTAERRLIEERNVIVVFDRDPNPEQRDAVSSCLD